MVRAMTQKRNLKLLPCKLVNWMSSLVLAACAKAAGWVGTGGAGHCGGWSNVGQATAAGDAEAIDGARISLLSRHCKYRHVEALATPGPFLCPETAKSWCYQHTHTHTHIYIYICCRVLHFFPYFHETCENVVPKWLF